MEGVIYVTKPKPRDLPVSLSFMTITSASEPKDANS